MKPTIALLTLAVAAIGPMLAIIAPAQAASRTWVSASAVAADTNPCTRAAPCATFAGAYPLTDAFGEINCLDPGSFGSLLIEKSITISCEAGTAGILGHGSNGYGIAVQATASTDIVYLRGLDLEGLSATTAGNATYGILFNGAGTLHIEKCLVRGYTGIGGQAGFGIYFAPTGNAALSVADTVIADNGNASSGGGILLAPTGDIPVSASLERVQMLGGTFGLKADGTGASALDVDVSSSRASGSQNNGFFATSTSGTVLMMIKNSTASNNAGSGVRASGANAEVFIGDSVISGNNTGVSTVSGGTILSYQNNQIDMNTSNGMPTANNLR